MAKSQKELMFSYYKKRPNCDIPNIDAVRWAIAEWEKLTGNEFLDPNRAIRTLCDEGRLIKVAKGVYRYESKGLKKRRLNPFTAKQKKEIFARDGYKCVICGKGVADGVEIHADHIRPQASGGKSTLENGQTLCAQHNYQKKTFNQTETCKKMFINFHKLAKKDENEKFTNFFRDLLDVYEKYDINGHIEWDDKP